MIGMEWRLLRNLILTEELYCHLPVRCKILVALESCCKPQICKSPMGGNFWVLKKSERDDTTNNISP